LEKLGIDFKLLISYIINFAILVIILRLLVYNRVLKMLQKRREQISQGLAEADRVRAEAEQQRRQYEQELATQRQENQERIQRAMQASEEAKEEIIAQARQETEQIKARARDEIEYERRQALEQVRGQVADLAILAARKVMDGALDEGAHRQLIQNFINQELDKELA
jgi:F-type H+-transporting ATPase subunit b